MFRQTARAAMAIKFGCVLFVQLSSVFKSPSSRRNLEHHDHAKPESPFFDMLVIYLN